MRFRVECALLKVIGLILLLAIIGTGCAKTGQPPHPLQNLQNRAETAQAQDQKATYRLHPIFGHPIRRR